MDINQYSPIHRAMESVEVLRRMYSNKSVHYRVNRVLEHHAKIKKFNKLARQGQTMDLEQVSVRESLEGEEDIKNDLIDKLTTEDPTFFHFQDVTLLEPSLH
jgi:hypothetical protein